MINSRFRGKWSEKPLSDLAVITMGQSPSSIFYNSHGEGLPLIQGNADIESRKTIERVWTTEGNKHCDLGDLILTVRAPVGAVAVASKNACIGRGVCGLQPFGNSSFLFHALVHTEDRWQTLEQGSTFTAANSEQVGQFQILVPDDEHEQRAIAEALSDVDGLLNALEALIAKKRAIKQATMQQLLTGKTRLPGFSGVWERKLLGEIASFFKGSSLFTKTDMSVDGKRRCIHYGELFTTYGECISETLHGTDREEAFFLSVSNDVLMPASDVTPNGLATASCISMPNVILGGDILVIRVPADVLNGIFLAYAIKMNRNQVMQLVLGTTVYHLYGRDMANFTFVAPSVPEQNAIVHVLSDMDAEIATLKQRRDKTHAIKHGMMQQLLTGRVRLFESRIIADDTDDAD